MMQAGLATAVRGKVQHKKHEEAVEAAKQAVEAAKVAAKVAVAEAERKKADAVDIVDQQVAKVTAGIRAGGLAKALAPFSLANRKVFDDIVTKEAVPAVETTSSIA